MDCAGESEADSEPSSGLMGSLDTDDDSIPPLEAIVLTKPSEGGFGFSIVGGCDEPYLPRDPGIYISKIYENGIAKADGFLAEGDKIIAVGDAYLGNVPHKEAVDIIRGAEGRTTFVVVKGAEDAYMQPSNIRKLFPLTSTKGDDEEARTPEVVGKASDPNSATVASCSEKLPEKIVSASPGRLLFFISLIGLVAVCMYTFKKLRRK